MRILILLFLSAPAHAGYFTKHVKDSIVINKGRKIEYAHITNGRSDRVLKRLITLERKMVPFAVFYDLRAGYYQRRKVPVLKNEFVDMKAPPIIRTDEIAADIKDIPWQSYRSELSEIIDRKDQPALLERTLAIIQEMKSQPSYWCLTRHLVESFYRFAWFLPTRIEEARANKVRSPDKLIWDIIEFHLIGFSRFVKIDKMAAPIQKEGIPLLCAELPDLIQDLSKE